MDSAMRDIEQLREKDDGEGRPLALVAILIGVTVVLVLALGMAVGGMGEDDEALESDPLARLDIAASEGVSESEPAPLPEVDRAELAFPEALASDERPEVAAALAAAAAELAHLDPLDPPAAHFPAALPAALAADTTADALARTVARDPLMAAALPAAPSAPPVAPGRDGEYTVQIISYDSPEGAEAFAAGLRSRGHRAFVMRAEVDGRGTMYRVRVGPFETQREAQAFRVEFERTERMSTLLVRRPQS
jgi:cell division septation protein DedD